MEEAVMARSLSHSTSRSITPCWLHMAVRMPGRQVSWLILKSDCDGYGEISSPPAA